MNETQFYLKSAVVLSLVAVVAGTALTAVGMAQDKVLEIVTTILGFAVVIVGQFRNNVRTAADVLQVAAKVEGVRSTLEDANAVASADRAKLKALGEATHILVNDRHGAALRALAVALRTLADLTGERAHRLAADRAAARLAEHNANQARVDAGGTGEAPEAPGV